MSHSKISHREGPITTDPNLVPLVSFHFDKKDVRSYVEKNEDTIRDHDIRVDQRSQERFHKNTHLSINFNCKDYLSGYDGRTIVRFEIKR